MANLLRLLVVDDEPGVLATFAANLEIEGFDVTTAGSAEEAIEASSKKGPFDLVLTDMRMPGMSGVDLVRRLRVLQPGIPVVIITAFAQEALVREAIGEGVFAVLSKPFDMRAVGRVVRRATKRPFVLVVDEARAEAASLASSLESIGLRARPVQSAGEAMLVVGMDGVDVCVVNALLRGHDGAELTAEIRGKKPEVAVIALSADASEEPLTRAAAAGAFGCVRKPVDAPALAQLIARARGAAA